MHNAAVIVLNYDEALVLDDNQVPFQNSNVDWQQPDDKLVNIKRRNQNL